MIDENGNCPYTAEEIFRASMEWINLHPNLSEEEQVGMSGLGMIWQKNHLIDKACEWLSKALDNFYIGTQQANFTDKVKFIESFKKAMRNNYETLDSRFRRVGSV